MATALREKITSDTAGEDLFKSFARSFLSELNAVVAQSSENASSTATTLVPNAPPAADSSSATTIVAASNSQSQPSDGIQDKEVN